VGNRGTAAIESGEFPLLKVLDPPLPSRGLRLFGIEGMVVRVVLGAMESCRVLTNGLNGQRGSNHRSLIRNQNLFQTSLREKLLTLVERLCLS
jgi:hypothetical protein